MFGFGGDRNFGLKALEIGANWPKSEALQIIKKVAKTKEIADFFPKGQGHIIGPGTRKCLCDINLMFYHIVPLILQIGLTVNDSNSWL
jgi:hypothetical protein